MRFKAIPIWKGLGRWSGGLIRRFAKHIELGIYKISARFDPASFTTPIPEHCWYGYSTFQNSFRLIRT